MSSVTINGLPATLPDDPDALLADVLRDDLALTGTKLVCGAGVCGACTVLLDGVPIVSCLTPAKAVAGQVDHHRRRHRRGNAASGAEGIHGARCPAMRLLHAGVHRRSRGFSRRLAQDEGDGDTVARGDRRCTVRPSLPLRCVREHSARGRRCLRRPVRRREQGVAAGRGARQGHGCCEIYPRHSSRGPARGTDPALAGGAREDHPHRFRSGARHSGRESGGLAARRGQDRSLRRRADRSCGGGRSQDGA